MTFAEWLKDDQERLRKGLLEVMAYNDSKDALEYALDLITDCVAAGKVYEHFSMLTHIAKFLGIHLEGESDLWKEYMEEK